MNETTTTTKTETTYTVRTRYTDGVFLNYRTTTNMRQAISWAREDVKWENTLDATVWAGELDAVNIIHSEVGDFKRD